MSRKFSLFIFLLIFYTRDIPSSHKIEILIDIDLIREYKILRRSPSHAVWSHYLYILSHYLYLIEILSILLSNFISCNQYIYICNPVFNNESIPIV
jgi:hypothetical protein